MNQILVIILLIVSATAQQVPRRSRCEAEATAWRADTTKPAADKLSAQILVDRATEMNECYVAYYGTGDFGAAANNYSHALEQRLWHFIQRHKLTPQFLREDDAGKR